MIYVAVKDEARQAFCTDLVPCDDEIVAIRWFYNFIHKSTYAKSCPNLKDLRLYNIVDWNSIDCIYKLYPVDNVSVCSGDETEMINVYNNIISIRADKVDTLATIPDVRTNVTEGEFVREHDKKVKEVISHE